MFLKVPVSAHYRKNVEMLNPATLYGVARNKILTKNNVEKKLNETNNELEVVGEALCELRVLNLRGAKGSLSAKRLATYMYETGNYPKQFKKEFGRKLNALPPTLKLFSPCDDDSLLISSCPVSLNTDILKGYLKRFRLSATPMGEFGAVITLSAPKPDGSLATLVRRELAQTFKP